MAHRLVGSHCQGGVEQHYSLFGPMREIAVAGDGYAYVILELFKYIDQGGRGRDAFGHGEAESVCLPLTMIGVLSQDYDLYVIEMSGVECIEDKTSRGVDRLAGDFFSLEMRSDLEEIGLGKF